MQVVKRIHIKLAQSCLWTFHSSIQKCKPCISSGAPYVLDGVTTEPNSSPPPTIRRVVDRGLLLCCVLHFSHEGGHNKHHCQEGTQQVPSVCNHNIPCLCHAQLEHNVVESSGQQL